MFTLRQTIILLKLKTAEDSKAGNGSKDKKSTPGAVIGKEGGHYPKRKEITATVLDNKVAFVAVGKAAKTKHDSAEYGIWRCGLHPVSPVIFKGGEAIRKI